MQLAVAQVELGLRWLHDRASEQHFVDLSDIFEALGWHGVLRGFTHALAYEYMQKLTAEAKSDPETRGKLIELSKRMRRRKS